MPTSDSNADNNNNNYSIGALPISSYWVNWSAKPVETVPFQAPSSIQAILTIFPPNSSQHQLFDLQPSILVVCWEGEILGFSPANRWSSVDWRCTVAAPRNLPKPLTKFQLCHAAYDLITDDIYFTIADNFDLQPYICRANLSRQLMMQETTCPLPLDQFVISTSSEVHGISIDSKRRLLFACQRRPDMISIWRMSSSPALPPFLTSVITSVKDPYFVAPYFHIDKLSDDSDKMVPPTSASIVKLAISRTGQNEVVVLQAKLSKFNERVFLMEESSSMEDDNTAVLVIDDIFKRQIIASKRESKPTAFRSVNLPWEVAFDQYGNLFVADAHNERIQVFSEGTKAMKAVWSSQCCTADAFQLAVIAVHPRTGKPAVLVSKGSGVIEWYY